MTSHSDNVSIFSYDGKEPPDTFNLDSLLDVVEKHFKTPCSLRKLTAGGYHKIYEIFKQPVDGLPERSLEAVARVACPAFPGDKLRSEVATLQYIALHTSVPVPEVYHWNADATNEVGAEYMIMQKIPGTPAVYIWNDLSFPIKERVVRQVAEHLSALFALRFAHAGSLYTPDASLPTATSSTPQPPQFYVGPAVSDNFYRAIEGHVDYASTDLHVPGSPSFLALQKFRGPFSSASDFIAHPLKALIYKCTTFPEESLEAFKDEPEKLGKPEVLLQRAVEAMEKGLELVKVYPGDADIYEVSTPDRPFTFFWDDFRLINIMIDEETGTVTGLLDFEGTMLVPTWQAAAVPQWIPDPTSDMAGWYGGSPGEQVRLWNLFHQTMKILSPEWEEAYKKGKPFREVAGRMAMGVSVWSHPSLLEWAENRIQHATETKFGAVSLAPRSTSSDTPTRESVVVK